MSPESPIIRSLDDRQQSRLPLKFYLGWRLALIAVLPAIVVAAYLTILQDKAAGREFRRELIGTARTASEQIEHYLQSHVAAVESLAAIVARQPVSVGPGWLQAELQIVRQRFPGFLTMIAADAEAWITAASPEHDQSGARLLERPINIADRDYFKAVIGGGDSYLSEVFEGRGFGSDPIVAISAPVARAGEPPLGIVQGSLDLGALAAFDPLGSRQPVELLVLDRAGRVIYSTDRQRFPYLEPVAGRSEPLRRLLARREGQLLEAQRLQRDEVLGAVLMTRYRTNQGWEVIGLRDMTPVIREQRLRWLITGLLILLIMAFSIVVTTGVAALIQRPLNRLADSFKANQPGRPIKVPRPPRGTPQELAGLFTDFRQMAQRLNRSFERLSQSLAASSQLQQELAQTLQSRDEVIERRTRDLQQRSRQLQEANRALEKQALEDPLTGLANRRAFVEFMDQAWRICMREHQPLSVIMLDVDNFKAYNDHYGHPAGDQALRQLAEVLKGRVQRPMDLVARLGGEEFAVVLGKSDANAVRDFAESLRVGVEDLAIIHGHGGAGPVLTASLGLATRTPEPGKAWRQLTIEADQALYRAKRQGRNRCVHFGSDEGGEDGRPTQV